MAETRAPAFLFVGNHPALDLLNTTPVLGDGDGPVDLLGTYDDLVRWIGGAGIGPRNDASELQRAAKRARGAQGNSVLREVKRLREALRSVLTWASAGRDVRRGAAQTINASLRRDRGYVALRGPAGHAGFVRQWRRERDDPAARIIAPIARSILSLLTEADLTRVRKCESPACVLWFLDTSKNGRRRWCSMGLCGNRAKVAAHYRRHRASATGSAARRSRP